jgi:hypothetical protein
MIGHSSADGLPASASTKVRCTLAGELGLMSCATGGLGSGLSRPGGDAVNLGAFRELDASAWEDRGRPAAPLDSRSGDVAAGLRNALPLALGIRDVGAMLMWCVGRKRTSAEVGEYPSCILIGCYEGLCVDASRSANRK